MNRSYLVGVDCGTQGVRAGVFDQDGHLQSLVSKPYTYDALPHGWAEQDVDLVLGAMLSAVREAVRESGIDPHGVVAIGVDATAVTLVASDRKGNALAPAILWMDSRAKKESEIVNASAPSALFHTGGMVSPEWAIPKVMWLKSNCPELYAQADFLVDLVDWLGFGLTGSWCATLSNLVSEWSYVPSDHGWSPEFLRSFDLEDLPQKVPAQVLPMGGVVGHLTKDAADPLGLRQGIPVVTAGMDSFAAGVGLGVTAEGRVVFSLGSSSCYLVQAAEPREAKGLFGPMPGPIEGGKWLTQGGQTSAASLLTWYADVFVPDEERSRIEAGGGSVYSWLDKMALETPPGSEGLTAVDTFQGNRTPLREPRLSGALLGLTLSHGRAHIYRALMESVACGGRMIIDAFRNAGISPREIYACGGGASSDLWMQIHADILDLPIVKTEVREAAALGSAMCAAVGAGFYPSLEESRKRMVRPVHAYRPNPDTRPVYEGVYETYKLGCRMMLEHKDKGVASTINLGSGTSRK